MNPNGPDGGAHDAPSHPAVQPSAVSQQVRDALTHVHDLAYLQTHPLARLLHQNSEQRSALAGQVLQERLLGAIERLRPGMETPATARAWRSYHLLSLRYSEGLDVAEVLVRLGISQSEYYREHSRGLETIVSFIRLDLLPARGLPDETQAPTAPPNGTSPTQPDTSSTEPRPQGQQLAPVQAPPAAVERVPDSPVQLPGVLAGRGLAWYLWAGTAAAILALAVGAYLGSVFASGSGGPAAGDRDVVSQPAGQDTLPQAIVSPAAAAPVVPPLPDPPLKPLFLPISIEPIMNAYWGDNLKKLQPGRHVRLAGVDFDLPDQRMSFASEIGLAGQIARPARASLPVQVARPQEIYFLVNLGNGFRRFEGKQIGRITLVFKGRAPLDTPLVAGRNIREWCVSHPGVITSTVDAATREAYREERDPSALTADVAAGCQVAIVDMLTIAVPAPYQEATLIEIQVEDTSSSSVGSADPQTGILGISVLVE